MAYSFNNKMLRDPPRLDKPHIQFMMGLYRVTQAPRKREKFRYLIGRWNETHHVIMTWNSKANYARYKKCKGTS